MGFPFLVFPSLRRVMALLYQITWRKTLGVTSSQRRHDILPSGVCDPQSVPRRLLPYTVADGRRHRRRNSYGEIGR